ncbi:MAG: dihydrodipicolinate synthase family protein [Victivallales bacterium]|jgi:4-hydroxy-tetrahydrodipicolinate synthase
MIPDGIIPPVLTPLNGDQEIDTVALRQLLDKLMNGGVHALFLAGTAGLGAVITQRQYEKVIETAVAHVSGRIPILAGVLEPSTMRNVERLKMLEGSGIMAAVVIPPYYCRAANDTQLLRHFEKMRLATSLELILYNIPVCTGTELSVEFICDMKKRGWITACKDSSGNSGFFADLCKKGGSHGLKVYQGMRPDFHRMEELGASGCVPVPANVFPEYFVDAWNKRKNEKELPASQKTCDDAWNELVVGSDFFSNSVKMLCKKGIGTGIMPEPF